MLSTLFARMAGGLIFGRVKAVLGKLPPWAWKLLLGAALLLGGYLWHQNVARKALDRSYSAGSAAADARWSIAFDKMQAASEQWRSNYEGESHQITVKIGEVHEANLRADVARADALRLRGPGRAAAPRCGPQGNTGLPASSSGHDEAGGGADAAMAGVPEDEPMAILPWGEIIDRAETADANRSEVIAWRGWYKAQVALLERMKREMEDAAISRSR